MKLKIIGFAIFFICCSFFGIWSFFLIQWAYEIKSIAKNGTYISGTILNYRENKRIEHSRYSTQEYTEYYPIFQINQGNKSIIRESTISYDYIKYPIWTSQNILYNEDYTAVSDDIWWDINSSVKGGIIFALFFILLLSLEIGWIINYIKAILIGKIIKWKTKYVKKNYTIKTIERWNVMRRPWMRGGGRTINRYSIKRFLMHPLKTIFNGDFVFWVDDRILSSSDDIYTRKVTLNEFPGHTIIFSCSEKDIPEKIFEKINWEPELFLKEFIMKHVKIGDKITLKISIKNPNIYYAEDPLKKMMQS